MGFDVRRVRRQFPILRRRIRTEDGRDRPLTYLDHGASTHAPQPVLDAVTDLLSSGYANVHRAQHTLSQEASEAFDQAAATLAGFIGADLATQPVCLTGNTTQALDLAAHLLAEEPGATVVSQAEHHSNDLPHRRRGPVLRAPVDDAGRLLLDGVEGLLQENTVKLLAVTGASNVTGLMPPVHKLARLAHDAGARILVDAAQLYAHDAIAVKPDGHPEHLDLVAAAGHKAYAPLGGAFLAAPSELVDAAPPHVTGGGTVEWVTEVGVRHKTGPERHSGGTPNIAGAIAFAASTRWLDGIGMDNVRDHELDLVRHGLRLFRDLADDHGVRLLGPSGDRDAARKLGVFSFTVPGLRHADVSRLLDARWGIATRNGCFCAQPLLNQLLGLGVEPAWTKDPAIDHDDVPGAVRASLGIYNTEAELDLLASALADLARGAKATDGKARKPSVALRERPPATKPGKPAGKPVRRIAARGR